LQSSAQNGIVLKCFLSPLSLHSQHKYEFESEFAFRICVCKLHDKCFSIYAFSRLVLSALCLAGQHMAIKTSGFETFDLLEDFYGVSERVSSEIYGFMAFRKNVPK